MLILMLLLLLKPLLLPLLMLMLLLLVRMLLLLILLLQLMLSLSLLLLLLQPLLLLHRLLDGRFHWLHMTLLHIQIEDRSAVFRRMLLLLHVQLRQLSKLHISLLQGSTNAAVVQAVPMLSLHLCRIVKHSCPSILVSLLLLAKVTHSIV